MEQLKRSFREPDHERLGSLSIFKLTYHITLYYVILYYVFYTYTPIIIVYIYIFCSSTSLKQGIAILVILFLLLPWRRLRWALPMPWDIFRQVSFANLRVVSPEPHAEDSERLGVSVGSSGSQGF